MSSTPLLALDVGSSTTSLGVFLGESLAHTARIPTQRDWSPALLAADLEAALADTNIPLAGLEEIAACSVVPALEPVLRGLTPALVACPLRLAGKDLPYGIEVRYDPPESAGPDRVVNAVAARELYGCPAAVLDLGTATTVDVVSSAGDFVGGAILPGIGIAREALYAAAPHLPRVELAPVPSLVGRSSAEALKAGFYFGAVAQIEGLARRCRTELGPGTSVIATGGLSWLVEGVEAVEAVDPHLTLRGLRLLWR